MGHAHFDWQPFDETKEVQIGAGNFDAIFNAFHRDALDSLLVRRICGTNSYSQGKANQIWVCHTNTNAETTCSALPSPFEIYILYYVCMLYV